MSFGCCSLFGARCWLLCVVLCMVYDVCWLLFGCVLVGVCCVLFVVCCSLLFVVCGLFIVGSLCAV